MAIYLTAQGGGSFTFPSLPESVKVSSPTNYQTYQLIGKGTAQLPNGMSIRSVSFSGVFFGASKARESIVQNWIAPTECVAVLEQWQTTGAVLEIVVDEAPINMDVTISSFSWTAIGGFGNIEYSIEFSRYVPVLLYTTAEIGTGSLTTARPDDGSTSKGVYTVKKGDNLWNIAREMYGGSGADWTKIMDANKDAIEETARKHGKANSDNGHWIYPGQVLEIPE